MGADLQRIDRSRAMAEEVIQDLPFIVGDGAIEESKKHLALAFGASPELFECTDASIGYAIALSAMSGLYPGGHRPDVWLIPRKNRDNGGKKEVNWQIAARGYQRLAQRAGFKTRAHVVHKHDVFEYETSEPRVTHRPDVDKPGDWGTIRLAYLSAVDPAGAKSYVILRKDQIEKRRRAAQSDKIWTAWPEEQTLKTMYAYAGARETWPTDSPTRFAMAATMGQEADGFTIEPAGGRRLLVADLQEAESAGPAVMLLDGEAVSAEELAALQSVANNCGVSFKAAYADQGWELPTVKGQMTVGRAEELEVVIRRIGREKGGCETCGTICEQSFCSEDCETRAGKAQ